jgi:integrase
MASLEKRKGGYRVVFRYAGRKYSRSLITSQLTAARASIARLEDNLRRLELGLLSPPPEADLCEFLLSDGRLAARETASSVRTLSDLAAVYFASLPKGSLEESTVYGMQIHVKHLKRILGRNLAVDAMKAADLQRYIEKRSRQKTRSRRPISPATIKKEIVTLRTIWNWTKNMGHFDRPFPGRGLKYAKLEAKLPFRTLSDVEERLARGGLPQGYEEKLLEAVFLSLDEAKELLELVRETATRSFVYPMFVFAAHTGARRSEMLRSEIDDIDLRSGTVVIRERKRIHGVKSTRIAPLSPLLLSVLGDWLKHHPGGIHTFCNEDQPRSGKRLRKPVPLTADEAHDHFKRALRGSRFEKLRGWHVFRHSFCSNCAARGIDQRVINAWVGHQIRGNGAAVPAPPPSPVERLDRASLWLTPNRLFQSPEA